MRLTPGLLVLLLSGAALAADVHRTLALSGLTCAACPAAVTKALKQVEGVVRDVTVNDERTQAMVVGDESVSLAALIAAVERAGFKATVAEGTESKKSENEARQESASDAPSRAATFEDVEGIEELRHLFNKDTGTTRLILLLSPT